MLRRARVQPISPLPLTRWTFFLILLDWATLLIPSFPCQIWGFHHYPKVVIATDSTWPPRWCTAGTEDEGCIISFRSRAKEQRRAARWNSFSFPPFPPFPYEHDDSLWQKCNKLLKRQPQNMLGFFFLQAQIYKKKKKAHTFNDIGLNYPLPAFGAIFKHYILQWSSVLNCYIWFIEVNSKTSKYNSTLTSLCYSRAIISRKRLFFLTLPLNFTNPSELEMTPSFLLRRNFLPSSLGFWWTAPCSSQSGITDSATRSRTYVGNFTTPVGNGWRHQLAGVLGEKLPPMQSHCS